MHGMAIDPYS